MTNAEAEPTLTENQKAYRAILKALPYKIFHGVACCYCRSVDEIATKCKGFSANGLASRMHEMEKMNLVCGTVRPGTRYKEWRITPHGREVLTKLKK